MASSRPRVFDAVLILDEAGTILDCNPAATQLFGYRGGELHGEHLGRLVAPSHRRGYVSELAELAKSEPESGMIRELPAQHKSGAVFPVRIFVGGARMAAGSRFVGIAQDIRDRLDTERRLHMRENELVLVIRHAPTAIATLDIEGRYVSVNQRFCSMLGYTEEQLIGRSFLEVTHPDDVAKSATYLQNLVQGAIEDYRLRKRYLHSDGRSVDSILHSSLVRDDQQAPRLIIAQIEDLTEQLRAETEVRRHREQLAQVSRLLTVGEMAAGIAHEINQPLSAIATYAQACGHMLRSAAQASPEILETLGKIDAQAQRAGEVIQHLRAFIRRQEGEKLVLDINDLVREVLTLAETDARANELGIVARLAEVPSVLGDRVQLQQVLLNLLRNAMEAMQESRAPDREVTIATSVAGEDVEVMVRDTGAGIPREAEGRLFDPFYTTKSSGLGMGLSISRSIVKSHGGRLFFTRNAGPGTTFHLTLPAYAEGNDGALETARIRGG